MFLGGRLRERQMIDVKSGVLKLDDSLSFYPGFSFEDFKKSNFYNGEAGTKAIYLHGKQIIDGRHYMVSFFFRNNKIYVVSLVNCDEDINEADEVKRKDIHDAVLKENKIENGYQYKWGRVLSEYDGRGNISSINIYYL